MPSNKKKSVIKNVEQLEEMRSAQDVDTSETPSGALESTELKMSPEAMEKFRRSIRDSHQMLYRNMLENVDSMIYEITTRLRRYEEATDLLADAEDAMHNLEEFTSRQRYTMPMASHAYVDRDIKLHLLAEVNLLVVAGRYPIGADGKARSLNPMQQSALWH